jgi:hypothetical protein
VAEAQPQREAAAPAAEDGGVYVVARANDRLYQGELLENVVEWTIGYDETNHDAVVGAQPIAHPLAVVLSQDCDLEQDYHQRQAGAWTETDLSSILFCPAFPAEDLRQRIGTQKINSARWNTIRNNKDDRYAYLSGISQVADGTGAGHPAILLDLTNYFTVRTAELYRQVRLGEAKPRCRLETPWREHFQLRFASYLGRIGLSRDHFIPESRRAALPAPAAPPA